MIALALAIFLDLAAALTLQPVQLLFDQREFYGGQCEQRAWEIEIGGRWYEAEPRRCG